MKEKTKKRPCVVCGKPVAIYDALEPAVCRLHCRCPRCSEAEIIIENGIISCSSCGSNWSSKDFEKVVAGKHRRTKCPYCSGNGYVNASKEIGCWDEST